MEQQYSLEFCFVKLIYIVSTHVCKSSFHFHADVTLTSASKLSSFSPDLFLLQSLTLLPVSSQPSPFFTAVRSSAPRHRRYRRRASLTTNWPALGPTPCPRLQPTSPAALAYFPPAITQYSPGLSGVARAPIGCRAAGGGGGGEAEGARVAGGERLGHVPCTARRQGKQASRARRRLLNVVTCRRGHALPICLPQ